METIVFSLDDLSLCNRYNRLLDACPMACIQQSTLWAEVIKDIGPDEPVFLLCHDNGEDLAGMPLYIYRHPIGNTVNSIPQPGPMGGIFTSPAISAQQLEPVYRSLINKAVDLARENDAIALTIITNQFEDDLPLYETFMEPDFLFENFTQYIVINDVIEDGRIVLRDYNRRSNLSRNVRKAKAAGFDFQQLTQEKELDEWYQVHAMRHREIGATPLDFRLFKNMFDLMMPKGKAFLFLGKKEREIVAGFFCIRHRDVMDIFMASMNPKYIDTAPNYFVTEKSLFFAHDSEVSIYNWQSSRDRSCGVYRFKKQWGSVESNYYFVTKLFRAPSFFQSVGREEIAKAYPGHYVVPFAAFDDGFSKRIYRKGE